MSTRTLRGIAIVLLAASLTACSTVQRLSEIGEPPAMTPPTDPTKQAGYRSVSMPMPQPQTAQPQSNSLWRPGARAFFKDQRAVNIGDIVTVIVNITDSASFENSTQRSRTAEEGAGVPTFFGLETLLADLLPGTGDTSTLVSASSTSSSAGDGSLEREESITLQMAAVVTQVLPNGLLAIAGRQEIRVNQELREVTISGVVRPEDITASNTITSEKIAEARISYGGRGTLSDVQQPGWGQQVYDVLMPW